MKIDKDKVFNILIFMGIGVVAYYLAIKFIPILLPFLVALVLALLLNPVVKLVGYRFHLKRGISTCIVMFLLILCIGGLTRFAGIKLIGQIKSLIVNLPIYQEQMLLTLKELAITFDGLFGMEAGKVEAFFVINWELIYERISTYILPRITTNSVVILTAIPNIFFTTVITLLATFFLCKDFDKISQYLCKRLPSNIKDDVCNELFAAAGGYLKAQLILMMFVGGICMIGLLILKNPYALLIGLCIALLDALPLFGSGFVLIPWIIYKLITRDFSYAVGLIITYLVCILVRETLEPKLVGDQIGIHPLLTLMAIYVGLRLFGVLGLLLGPLTLVLCKTLFFSKKWANNTPL